MVPIVTVFDRSPYGGKGLARDTRVRWALEEVGQPYTVRPVTFRELAEAEHRARHPFGQIPTYEMGDIVLFESGGIVLHIAETHLGLLPREGAARARAIAWMFASLSTIEPPVLELQTARFAEGDKPWTPERLPLVLNRIRNSLEKLSLRLGDADWLDGAFSAGDLMMASVLQRVRPAGVLTEFPNLVQYVERAEARPPFQRAFEAQRTFNQRPG